jgi:type II secretory pathway pseudopilin PulG
MPKKTDGRKDIFPDKRNLGGFTPSKIENIRLKMEKLFRINKRSFTFNQSVRRFSTGFTLIEVAVTSAILIFLMSAVWSSGSLRATDFSVMISQEKLRLLTTRAKSMTINSVFGTANNTCGYGIRIEQRKAFIFIDRGACGAGNNRRYDSGEEVPGSANSITLAEGIVFLPSTGENVEVVFIPPDPRTVINGSDGINEVDIEVRAPSGMSRRVIINKQGLINMKN